MGDEKHNKDDDATNEDDVSCLQLNRGNRNFGIASLADASPKRSWQACLNKPTPGNQQSAHIKNKTSARANVMCSISNSPSIPKSPIYIITILANLNARCDDSGLNEPLSS